MSEEAGKSTIENLCSECGQSFSASTKICPNDGTRLVAPTPDKKKKNGSSANTKNLKVNRLVGEPADSIPTALSAGSLMAQALSEELLSPEDMKTRACVFETQQQGEEPATFAQEAALRAIGTIVNDQYKIMSAIGYGGMSIVFKAKDLKLGKFVAVKMLLPHLMLQSHSMQRFHQEAQSASALNHRNVVAIHNYGETESGQPFLVMDLIEGVSLSDEIKKHGHLPVDRALNIFIQLTSALAHAHQNGVIHRDLKPSNVLLTEENEETDVCKIVDFGIAKLLPHEGRDAVSLTQTGDVFGSPLYMSPEQCKGEKLDHKADVYSMGCLMYETLSGTTPHSGNNMLEVLYRHMNEVPKDFKSLKLGIVVPQRLEAAIFKALAKDPANRHVNMQTLHDELKQIFLFRKTSFIGRVMTSWELFVLKRRPRKKSEFITLGALAASLLGLFAVCAFLVSLYVFADESPVFKQKLDWKVDPLPLPADVGETAITVYQNSIDTGEAAIKNSSVENGAEILDHLAKWGGKMASANRWDESAKAFGLALELSKRWNGNECLPTLSLRRQFARSSFFAKDYAFSAREFALYRQHVSNFLYGETAANTLQGMYQSAEAYYYLHQFSDAVTAYRHFFVSMQGHGLDWTHWTSIEIGRYMNESNQFKKSPEYALLLSHYGEVMQKEEMPQKAEESYKAAAFAWKQLKKSDNAALAYLKCASVQESLNENPRETYEDALRALKPDATILTTCIAEKQYADYLWRNGDAIKAMLLKLDYSSQIPKVKL